MPTQDASRKTAEALTWAHQGPLKARQHSLQELPAVAFEGKAVVYGLHRSPSSGRRLPAPAGTLARRRLIGLGPYGMAPLVVHEFLRG